MANGVFNRFLDAIRRKDNDPTSIASDGAPSRYYTQTDSNWKNDFYDLFFHQMENQYHVNVAGSGFASTGKARASMVNTMFTRVPIGHEEIIGTFNDGSTTDDGIDDGDIGSTDDERSGLIQTITRQGGGEVVGAASDALNVETGIHRIHNPGSKTKHYAGLVNYNKHRFILGPRTAVFGSPNNPEGPGDLMNPEWRDENEFETDNLVGEKADTNTDSRQWDSWLSKTRSRRAKQAQKYLQLRELDLLDDQAAGTGSGEKDKASQAPSEENGIGRLVAYDSQRRAIQNRWNTYGFSDVYLERRELEDIYDISTKSIINHFSPTPTVNSDRQGSAGVTDLNNMMLKPADFAYLRQHGHYSNNRLVILRRYEKPVGNDPTLNPDNMPISTMITWLPPNEEMISFKGLQENWKSVDETLVEFFKDFLTQGADIATGATKMVTGLTGLVNDIIGLTGKGIKAGGKSVGLGSAFSVASGIAQAGKLEDLATIKVLQALGFSASPQVRGNVRYNPNLVTKSMSRNFSGGGDGIEGSFDFDFETEYEYKFFAGHDPEQSMLDIIANTLTMFTSDREPLIQPQSLGSWKRLNDIMHNREGSLGDLIKNFNNQLNLGTDSIKSFIEATRSSFDNYGAFLYSAYEARLKAAIAASTGEPNGVWHLTIGNPKKPIVSIGNLVLRSGSIDLNTSEMSMQDFPTRIRVGCSLTNATPLGRQDVENVLSAGFGRIYNNAHSLRDKTWYAVGDPISALGDGVQGADDGTIEEQINN